MKLDLPSGGWAELRDFEAEPLNNRERTRVLRAMSLDLGSNGQPQLSMADFWMLVSALCVEAIREWSFELPLPSTTKGMLVDPLESTFGELSMDDSNVIGQAVQSYAMKLMPDFSPNPDRSSPT